MSASTGLSGWADDLIRVECWFSIQGFVNHECWGFLLTSTRVLDSQAGGLTSRA